MGTIGGEKQTRIDSATINPEERSLTPWVAYCEYERLVEEVAAPEVGTAMRTASSKPRNARPRTPGRDKEGGAPLKDATLLGFPHL